MARRQDAPERQQDERGDQPADHLHHRPDEQSDGAETTHVVADDRLREERLVVETVAATIPTTK